MSYGTSIADMNRQVGVYTGRILKGEKPADFRCAGDQVRVGHQPQDGRGRSASKCPPTLLARADEVIE